MQINMMRRILPLLFILSSCSNDGLISDSDERILQFDGATLVVHSPGSASIHLVSDPMALEAEIIDTEGNPIEFEGIVWTSNALEAPIFEGPLGEIYLDLGIHDITASALLPNGDRLEWTQGGVRVQSAHTGVYAGSIEISLEGEFQGTPVTAVCRGPLDFVVDMRGEVLGGEGACSVDLVVIDGFDLNYAISADIDGNIANGQVEISMGPFPVPLEWEGLFDGSGSLEGDFAGDIMVFDMVGKVDARRVTLYVDP